MAGRATRAARRRPGRARRRSGRARRARRERAPLAVLGEEAVGADRVERELEARSLSSPVSDVSETSPVSSPVSPVSSPVSEVSERRPCRRRCPATGPPVPVRPHVRRDDLLVGQAPGCLVHRRLPRVSVHAAGGGASASYAGTAAGGASDERGRGDDDAVATGRLGGVERRSVRATSASGPRRARHGDAHRARLALGHAPRRRSTIPAATSGGQPGRIGANSSPP